MGNFKYGISWLELLTPFIIYGSIIFIALTFKLWLFGSLAVSGVKALSDNCGKEYPVEVYVVYGDWFCSSDKKEK